MENRKNYLKALDSKMKKYKNKILEIDKLLKKSKSPEKALLVSESNSLKEKFKQAEDIFQRLKSSSQENFADIKESSVEIFESLKEAYDDCSHLLTMDQLYQTKDDIAGYGNEKICEVGNYIKKKPLTCAAWAFGVGFLIGTFLTRSK